MKENPGVVENFRALPGTGAGALAHDLHSERDREWR